METKTKKSAVKKTNKSGKKASPKRTTKKAKIYQIKDTETASNAVTYSAEANIDQSETNSETLSTPTIYTEDSAKVYKTDNTNNNLDIDNDKVSYTSPSDINKTDSIMLFFILALGALVFGWMLFL